MYNISIKETNHIFDKINLVTKSTKKGSFDELVCKNCGLKGRRYNLESVTISEIYGKKKVNNCPNAPRKDRPKKVRITDFRGHGKVFGNIIKGTEHEVIDPPAEYKKDRGIWLMGVGEPIKILSGEYEIIE